MARRDALTELRVAFDCPAKWDDMKGDGRSRHCGTCKRNVYNISDMSREEAIAFLESKGARVCVRYYQRADGTVLTKPCGKMKRVAYRGRILASSICAALGILVFPMTAATSGARALSPADQVRMSLKRLTDLRRQLAEENDSDSREVLQEMIKEQKKRLSDGYRRMDPQQMEKWVDADKKLNG